MSEQQLLFAYTAISICYTEKLIFVYMENSVHMYIDLYFLPEQWPYVYTVSYFRVLLFVQ
jgi:hypothetical protein